MSWLKAVELHQARTGLLDVLGARRDCLSGPVMIEIGPAEVVPLSAAQIRERVAEHEERRHRVIPRSPWAKPAGHFFEFVSLEPVLEVFHNGASKRRRRIFLNLLAARSTDLVQRGLIFGDSRD